MAEKDNKPQGRGSFSLGDVLLERGKHRDDDIGDVWAEQKRIREHEALLEIEYRQAKEKAKQIKATIKQHQIGDETLFGDDLKKYIAKTPKTRVSTQLKKGLQHAQSGLRSVPRPSRTTAIKKSLRLTKKRVVLGSFVGLIALSFILRPLLGSLAKPGESNSGSQETLGQSTAGESSGALQEVTSTEFELLYPAGVNPDNVKVVKINPENTATVYSYIDKFENTQLRISEQRVPESFKPATEAALQKLAESFNAKSVVQIDNAKVYHGKNEGGGTAQSLLFIKKDLLIFIAASQGLTDDKWAAYISSFN
jgi:hypothetical protein